MTDPRQMNIYEKVMIPVASTALVGAFVLAWKTNVTLERATDQVARNTEMIDLVSERLRVTELELAVAKERLRRADPDGD